MLELFKSIQFQVKVHEKNTISNLYHVLENIIMFQNK